ncbi:hypothetical protein MKX03_032201 [Papaver bracteatum]|nr:hypothetical protein MKX03_032201 [Papaver bracteatum]
MEASVEVIFLFEDESLPFRVTKSTTIETLKTVVCGRWTVLNPWSVRFVLKGQCNQVYVDSDFALLAVFERFFMRGVSTFNIFCKRFVCPTTPMSPAPCQNPIPTSCSDKNPTTVQAIGPRVVSPVSKDAIAKKYFKGSQASVKQKKSKLWKQAITGVGQIFYNGVQEVRNVVTMVCFENGHEPDSKKRKSETSGIPFDAKIGNLLDVYGSSMPNRSLKIIKFLRYDEVSSSVAESVNNWVKDEKRMPVSSLVNTIRMKLMELIHKRHKISETMTSRLNPDYENKLNELTNEGNYWIVIPAGDTLFEVVAYHRCAVNLETFHCSCNRWKVYGFPCSHAIQCILLSGKQVYDFVQPYFTSSWYKSLYSFAIHPVPDSEKENESSDNVRVIPPPVKKGPGRPKTERFYPKYVKMKSEKRKIRCGNCKRLSNHNSRTCSNQEVHDFSGI